MKFNNCIGIGDWICEKGPVTWYQIHNTENRMEFDVSHFNSVPKYTAGNYIFYGTGS